MIIVGIVIGFVILVFFITIYLSIKNNMISKSGRNLADGDGTNITGTATEENDIFAESVKKDLKKSVQDKGCFVEITNEQEVLIYITENDSWMIKEAVTEYVFQRGIEANEAICLEYQKKEDDQDKIKIYFQLNDTEKSMFMVTYDRIQHRVISSESDIKRHQIVMEEEAPLIRDVILPNDGAPNEVKKEE